MASIVDEMIDLAKIRSPKPGAVHAPPTAEGDLPRISLRELLAMRVFWRALWFSVCLLLVSKQWGDLDQLLPAYLERQYGEGVPVYRIHSINTWVCMLGPSLAAALTPAGVFSLFSAVCLASGSGKRVAIPAHPLSAW